MDIKTGIKNTVQDFHPFRLPDLFLGLVFLLISPAIGLAMNKPKIVIYGAWLGVSLLLWLVANRLVAHISTHSQDNSSTPPSPVALESTTTKAKTLHDYFKEEFPGTLKLHQPRTGVITTGKGEQANSQTLAFEAQLHADFESRSLFMSFYIPDTPKAKSLCQHLAEGYKTILSDLTNAVAMQMKDPGQRGIEFTELKFTGGIYLYTETPFFDSELSDLTRTYQAQNLSLSVRDVGYAFEKNKLAGN